MSSAVLGPFETRADKRRYLRRLLVMHFFSLIVCAICIAIATWAIAMGIEDIHRKSQTDIAASLIVGGLIAVLFWYGAIKTQANMVDQWRDFRRPLPPIDGSEIVLTRKRANRFLPTVFQIAWLIGWTRALASKWPDPVVLVFGAFFFIYPAILGLKAIWLPKVNDWASLLIDGEGFEDCSGSSGRIAWTDVVEVSWSNGSIAVKMTKPLKISARPRLREWLARWPRRQQNSDVVEVRGHGFRPDSHRAFRLLQAYWRYSKGGLGRDTATVTRSLR
jgi:hypothetical protein